MESEVCEGQCEEYDHDGHVIVKAAFVLDADKDDHFQDDEHGEDVPENWSL